ncbi:MAG: hypothetical protein UY65_C0018G0011 [Parcubacteria group bacterium GW2011_GWA2_51_12]|nr:MAG: hypothetical protein UY65_C0018G0011 [Parcubacteria group bacterium GW2011_GWA2_51_12]
MSNQENYRPTPEEQAKLEKERTLSDADLLKKGAEYKIDEFGEKRLEVTKKQLEDLKAAGKSGPVENPDFDLKRPRGDSLFEDMLDFAKGCRTQRPDLFDPKTNTWTEWGRTRLEQIYPQLYPKGDFDKVVDRVERELKNTK